MMILEFNFSPSVVGRGGERGAALTPPLRDNWRGWDRPFPSDPNRTEVMYGRDKGYFPNIWIVRKYFIHC